MRKFLSILGALLMCAMMWTTADAATQRVFCKTQSWWSADGAAVAVHYWGGSATGTTWPGVRMTSVSGEDGLWYYDVPSDVTGLMFVRVNGSGDIADWNAKTKDLALQTDGKVLYTISSTAVWGDPGCDGTWSSFPISTNYAYVKVTSAPASWEGTYLIVYETGKIAMDGGLKTLDAVSNSIDVTINNDTIGVSTFTDFAAFTVTADANNEGWYQLKSASGYYIAGTTTAAKASNGIKQTNVEKNKSSYLNQFNVGEVLSKSSDQNMTLRYNKTADQKRFRYYKSGQEAIALYKRVKIEQPPVDSTTLYFVNTLDWASVKAYPFKGETGYKTWPGEAMKKTADKAKGKDIYSYTFPSSFTSVVFNNGSDQTVDLPWNEDKPYFVPGDKNGEGKYEGTWYASKAEIEAKDSVYFVNVFGWENPKVYMWNSETDHITWPGIAMTKLADKINGFDVYKVVTDKGAYAKCLFDDGKSEGGEQTADLTWTSEKYFYVDAWYALADIPDLPDPDALYTVSGEDGSLFYEPWLVRHMYKYTDMKKQGDTYIYKWNRAGENVALFKGKHAFRIFQVNPSDNSKIAEWPVDKPDTFIIDVSSVYNVAFTFNAITKKMTAVPTRKASYELYDFRLMGFGDWSTGKEFILDEDLPISVTRVTLTASETPYTFKLKEGETWYGAGHKFYRNYPSHNDVLQNGDNMELYADVDGEYIFVYNFELHQLKVLYPDPVPARKIEALTGVFTINGDGDKINFSRGNLRYNYKEDAWYTGTKQYESLGFYNLRFGDAEYKGSVDLFGFSCESSNFGLKPSNKNADFTGNFVDWGTKFDAADGWRTLSKAEWNYILGRGEKAWTMASLSADTIIGLILFPDGWTDIAGITIKYKYYDLDNAADFKANNFSFADWDKMEAAGAVFLPLAGSRSGAVGNKIGIDGETESTNMNPLTGWYCWVSNINEMGYYWFSDQAYAMIPGVNSDWTKWTAPITPDNRPRRYGNSVRLVRKEKPVIKEDLKLVPGVWAEAGAKMAAWTWGKDLAGAWTAFFAGEGDTLTAAINAEADSVIFVRFNSAVAAPTWDDQSTNIWNRVKDEKIDHEGLTYTITGWGAEGISVGQWTPYEPVVPGKYYITGDSALVVDAGLTVESKWNPAAIKAESDTTVLNLKAGVDYKLKVTTDGTWATVLGYDKLSKVAEGLSNDADDNICFKLAEAGAVKVVYFVKDEKVTFELLGNFYVKPVIKEDLKLVPGVWAEAGAKMAAWTWGKDLAGAWTAFFAGEGDTLTAAINAEADSVIFVRFNSAVAAPTWDDQSTNIWNRVKDEKIDHEGLTYTITGWGAEGISVGQWTPYVPSGCDWDNIQWLGSTDAAYAEQFKVCVGDPKPTDVVNIQSPGWATEIGIYITFPSAAFTSFSLPTSAYDIDGAGVIFHISAFTAKETEVTVVCESKDYVFTVFNKKGTEPIVGDKYYMKNNWDAASDWTWKEMTKDGDNYKLENVVFGGTGVNYNTEEVDATATWVPVDEILGDKIGAKDTVNFVLNPAVGTVTATLIGKYQPSGCEGKFGMKVGETIIEFAKNEAQTAWIEYYKEGVELTQGQVFTLYDICAEVAFTATIDGYTGFTQTTEGWTVTETGKYDFYLKLITGADELYVVKQDPTPGDAKFYICGSGALLGNWEPADAIAVKEDSYTFTNMPVGSYSLKVLTARDWQHPSYGFTNLTGTIPAGVTAGEQNNICFTIAEANDVTITFKANGTTIETFTIAGTFSTDTPKGFFITGNEALMGEGKAWNTEQAIEVEGESYTFKQLAAGVVYQMKVLVVRDWAGAQGYSNLTVKPEGVYSDQDENINFILATAGDVKVTFIKGVSFMIEGNFYVKPTEEEYGLMINGTTFIKAEKNPATENEYMALDVALTAGQTFQIYDNVNKLGWVITNWNEGSYQFTVDGDHYVVTETAKYDFYVNLEYGNDYIYVAQHKDPSALENLVAPANELRKVMIDGKLYILRDGKVYSVQGQLIR